MECDNFNVFTENQNTGSVKVELNEDIKMKCINMRNNFYRLFLMSYTEQLTNVIKYEHTSSALKSIDWLKVEMALRSNYQVVIGQNRLGQLNFLGFAYNRQGVSNPTNFFMNHELTYDDIHFIVPPYLIPKREGFKEITHLDKGMTGNFIVLRNKSIDLTNDMLTLKHYASTMAEIQSSRYSLIMQSKVMTFFKGSPNNETLNQVISDLYNGSPWVKTTKAFNEDSIVTMDNSNLANNLSELKREWGNQLNELNSFMGVDTLGIDKESGVSNREAMSGNPFSKNNANKYINSRNNALRLLNRRFGTDVVAVYDNNVKAEMNEIEIGGIDNG